MSVLLDMNAENSICLDGKPVKVPAVLFDVNSEKLFGSNYVKVPVLLEMNSGKVSVFVCSNSWKLSVLLILRVDLFFVEFFIDNLRL